MKPALAQVLALRGRPFDEMLGERQWAAGVALNLGSLYGRNAGETLSPTLRPGALLLYTWALAVAGRPRQRVSRAQLRSRFPQEVLARAAVPGGGDRRPDLAVLRAAPGGAGADLADGDSGPARADLPGGRRLRRRHRRRGAGGGRGRGRGAGRLRCRLRRHAGWRRDLRQPVRGLPHR